MKSYALLAGNQKPPHS